MFAGGWLIIVVAPETVSVAGSGKNNTFLTKQAEKLKSREMKVG